MAGFTGEYEFAKTTQRMVMLVHRTKVIRVSELPYLYLSKKEYRRLGGKTTKNPNQVFTITVEKI